MSEHIGNCTIKTRNDKIGPDYIAWLYMADWRLGISHVRGNLGFRNVDEIKAAIRELRKLLPVIDQLGEVVDGT